MPRPMSTTDRERRSAAAKLAAATRAHSRQQVLFRVVRRLREGGTFTPAEFCEICGRWLDDRQSKARGIGPECWWHVLAGLTKDDDD
jgi:hypothetical protein